MKFRATVADAKTGSEFETLVPGVDENEARNLLRQRGLMVSKIEPAEIIEDVPELPSWMMPRKQQAKSLTARYPAMAALSKCLRIFAILCYVSGITGIVSAIAIAFLATQYTPKEVHPFPLGSSGIFSIVCGLLLHAVALALIALRDIAENSFKN